MGIESFVFRPADVPLDEPVGVPEARVEPVLDFNAPVVDYGFHARNEKPIDPTAARGSLMGAAFRQENVVGAFMSRKDMGIDNTPEDGYQSAWKDIAGTKYEPYWDRFVNSNNARYTSALKSQIDMELDDRRTLESAGWQGTVAAMAAGIIDPTTLLPGGAMVKAVKGGYLVSRSALAVAMGAAAGAAVQEGVLQSQQQLRPWEESAVAVGGSVVLGALLGASGAALLNRGERQVAESAARVLYGADDAAGSVAGNASKAAAGGIAGSVGAAAVELPSREALAVEGKGAQAVLDTMGGLTPNTRLMNSPSASARRIGAELTEGTVYRNMHADGDTTGYAVETIARVNYNSRIRQSVSDHNELFKAGRKAGMGLTKPQFEEAVGKALRRGDVGENEWVSKAAQAWRRNLFDPFKDEAIEAKLLPADVRPDGAVSYFSRVYDRPRLIAGEADFKGRITSHYEPLLQREFGKHVEATQARIAELEQEAADLRMSADQRVKTLGDLQTSLRDLESRNIDKIETAERITALTKTARDAAEKGDRATAQTARAEADRLKKEGGKEFAAFLKERGKLRSRARRVDLNYAGLEARQNRILQQLSDIEESNLRGMSRLVARGRKLEQEASRLDPVLRDEKMSEFRTAFNRELAKSEKSLQRIADARAKLMEGAERGKGQQAVANATGVREPAGVVSEAAGGNQGGVRADTRAGTAVPQARFGQQAEWEAPSVRMSAPEIRQDLGVDIPGIKYLDAGSRNAGDGTRNFVVFDDKAIQIIGKDGKPVPLNDYLAGQAVGRLEVTQELRADLTPPVGMTSDAASIFRAAMDGKPATVADLESAIERAAQDSAPPGMRVKQSSVDELKGVVREAADMKPPADDAAAKLDAMLAREANAEANRVERMNSLARRMEALDAFNPEERLFELKRITDELAREVSERSLAKGEKAAVLKGRFDQFDPERIAARDGEIARMKAEAERGFYDRWEVKRGGENVDLYDPKNVNFNAYARQIADQVYDKIMGKNSAGVAAADFMTPLTSGPLKERTFHVPDELIEDFLDSNVLSVGERYGRSMASQIEMTRRFGRADMRDQLDEVATEFRKLREAVQAAPSREEAYAIVGKDPSMLDGLRAWMRGGDEAAITKERLLQYLHDAEKQNVEDLSANRDLILGRYNLAESAGDYARMARNLMHFNYIRVMGGSGVINAISEVYRPAMVHGLKRFMGDGIAPLIKNLDAVKMSVREAQLAGQVTDVVNANRLMTLGEIGDPYKANTAIERILKNGTTFASKWNGLVYWTDAIKSISSVMSQNRIIEGVMGEADDTRFLAFLGIGKKNGMAGRIAEQFRTHGKVVDGVKVANTEAWTDKEAVRVFRAALSKDVDSIIVTRSVGDVPLFANTTTGKMILQFRTFNIAAMQRVMMRGMQEEKAKFLTAIATMSTLGMMAAAFRSWRGGEERWEKFKKAAQNPGYLIGEGLDNSGIFTVPFEIANTAEKFLQGGGYDFNPIKKPLIAAFPGQSQAGESTRFASRGVLGGLLGPTAGMIETTTKAIGGNQNAMAQMLPFGSYVGMREFIQTLTDDSPYLKR